MKHEREGTFNVILQSKKYEYTLILLVIIFRYKSTF